MLDERVRDGVMHDAGMLVVSGAKAITRAIRAGVRAREAGVKRLYTLGPLSEAAAQAFGEGARHFDTHAALATALSADLSSAGTNLPPSGNNHSPFPIPHSLRVLVKGSRGSAMDKIVTALLKRDEDTPHVA